MKCTGLLAFIGGALAGAAAAILLAPDSGENTRRKIKERAQQEYEHLKGKVSHAAGECAGDNYGCE